MPAKKEPAPEKPEKPILNLQQRINLIGTEVAGLKKTASQRGEYFKANRVMYHVKEAMNTHGVNHNVEINEMAINEVVRDGKTPAYHISVDSIITWINSDDTADRESVRFQFFDITHGSPNTPSVITKLRKNFYLCQFCISADDHEDADQPFKQQSGYRQAPPASNQTSAPKKTKVYPNFKIDAEGIKGKAVAECAIEQLSKAWNSMPETPLKAGLLDYIQERKKQETKPNLPPNRNEPLKESDFDFGPGAPK